ncbi:putative RNA-binding protein EEED8.10 [Chelonus insularis]|uniref:putative RNA-binding protein EEED8.10 n=1 Tax=Chelonus insularis TaxID=460826 RepID=UPI00158D8B35|nr:putative RNA-binding protein EEED8.10 [Chelonus insularis]XP_034934515.1 putative RNA-binding protein EEED8.10 [Chelonus insularis]
MMSNCNGYDVTLKKKRNDGNNLDIWQRITLTDECLKEIFLHTPVIDRIRLERVCKQWQKVSRKSWEAVEKLVITSPRDAQSSVVEGTKDYVSLRTLKSHHLKLILSRCGQYIRHFALEEFGESFDPHFISTICEYCHNIEHIDILEMQKPHFKGVGELLAMNKNIKVVKFIACGQGVDACLRYSPSQYLEKLVLCFSNHGQELTHLHEILSNARFLKSLKLREYNINTYTLELISKLPRLIKLYLVDLEMDQPALQEALLRIPNITTLQVLSIKGKGVTDEFLIKLAKNCRQLESLDIGYCQNVTERGLEAIDTLSELRNLDVSEISRVDDDILANNFHHLERLKCSGCKSITSKGLISFIRQSLNLRDLRIWDCSLENVKEMLNAAAGAVEARCDDSVLVVVLESSFDKSLYADFTPYLDIRKAEDEQ